LAASPPGNTPRRPALADVREESPGDVPGERPREGVVAREAADDASEVPEEPDVPVVSALARGADATAEPTPRATANAPSRPM